MTMEGRALKVNYRGHQNSNQTCTDGSEGGRSYIKTWSHDTPNEQDIGQTQCFDVRVLIDAKIFTP